MLKIKKALVSVSDKSGLDDLVKTLARLGVELLSTGGTAKRIKELGLPVKDVSEYTGFPEMMDGRVKTLHPKIHGGLLALRNNESHVQQALENKIDMIDMVVVNLYPFEKTVAKKGVKTEEAIENIDIGGPSMLRSAAKNYRSVAVITDPSTYADIIEELDANEGCLSEATLKNMAVEVFKRTSEYDKAIYGYLGSALRDSNPEAGRSKDRFPAKLSLNFTKVQDLRYGENPHQKAAFYKDTGSTESGICNARQLQGKELSFNNILDLNTAIEIVKDFDKPAASIIKHNNPCGAAVSDSPQKAYIDALECDRLSAFGSIVGFNMKVDAELAEFLLKEADFVECVIAPSFDENAQKAFSKKKNLRLLEVPDFKKTTASEIDYKKVVGGILAQDIDVRLIKKDDIRLVTKTAPSAEDIDSLLFGWKIVKHVRSNAIVLCRGTKTVGIGAGQMSRVDSVIIACRKAANEKQGSTLASDAFFPKRDAIDQAHEAGIRAIIQPGGSKADNEIIEACDEHNIAMVFTGARHFKH